MGQTSCHRWKKESENVRKRNGESAGRGGRERERNARNKEKRLQRARQRGRGIQCQQNYLLMPTVSNQMQ